MATKDRGSREGSRTDWQSYPTLSGRVRLVPILVSIFPFGSTWAGDVISLNALAQCAQAGVAECQYRYAHQLEMTPRRAQTSEIRTLYEKAYSGGYEPAGAAILRLLEDEADSTPVVTAIASPAAVVDPRATAQTASAAIHQTTTDVPSIDRRATAAVNESTEICSRLPVKATDTRNGDQTFNDQDCSLLVRLRALSAREGTLVIEVEFSNESQTTVHPGPITIHASQSGTRLRARDSRAADRLLTGVKALSGVATALPIWRGASLLSRATATRNLGGAVVDKAADSARGRIMTDSSAYSLRIGSLSSGMSKSEFVTFELNNAEPHVEITLDINRDARVLKIDLPR